MKTPKKYFNAEITRCVLLTFINISFYINYNITLFYSINMKFKLIRNERWNLKCEVFNCRFN